MDRIKIKVNHGIPGYASGVVVEIEARDGVPTDENWRRRISDAETDGCCELVTDQPKAKPKARSSQSKRSAK
jgi:hypothetical protein